MTMGVGELPFEPAIGSTVGRRDEQQDTACVEEFVADDLARGLLLVIADGMGGHAGGREASRIAVDTYCAAFLAEPRLPVQTRLQLALRAANQAIGARAGSSRELHDMGCTLVAATLVEDWLHWVSVGDSLLLEARNGRIVRLNADHSLAPEIDRAAREGHLSQAEADCHPDRNVLLAAVNGAPLKLVDEGMRRVEENSLILLATDGILSLSGEQLAAAISGRKSAAEIVQDVLAAIEADMPEDQDNATLVAARICALPAAARGRRRRRVLGALCLLASIGGATGVAFILEDNGSPPSPLVVRDRGQPGSAQQREASQVAEKAPERIRLDRPEHIDRARARPGQAAKKPPRAPQEPPHFSLAAPASRTPAPQPAEPSGRSESRQRSTPR